MTIDNVYAFMDVIWKKRMVDGPVLEIGVASGGMTLQACKFLSRIGCKKQYYCLDTFSGFVKEQLATDHKLGLTSSHDDLFRDNSLERVKETLAKWGVRNNIHFVKIDICKAIPTDIPDNISVCLLDVDLRDPIYDGLKLLWKKLAPGGIILIDDCKDGTSWVGADKGYLDFIEDNGLTPRYWMGLGVLEAPSSDKSLLIDWETSNKANSIVSENFYG